MIRFTSDFPGGNGVRFRELSAGHWGFDVDLHGRETGLWFCFQIEGAEGRLTLDLGNGPRLLGWPHFAGIRPVYGRPGDWRRIPEGATVFADRGVVRFEVPCAEPTRVAFCYPYTLEELDRFRHQLLADGRVREVEVAQTAGGHPVRVWEAGSGARGLWLLGRTHAGEAPASYVLEGFMRELLRPEHERLLEELCVRTCPMVDVDNVQAGAYGKFGPPCDPYMDWSERPTLPGVAGLQAYFAAAPERPAAFVDLHCPEPRGSTYACTWSEEQAPAEYCVTVDALCRRLYEESRDPLKFDLSRTRGYPGWFGSKLGASTQGYFRERYGCPALTLETSYHHASAGELPDEVEYRSFGAALYRTLCRGAGLGLESRASRREPGD